MLRILNAPKGTICVLAERVGLSLRDRACGFAAAPVEQGSKSSTLSAKMQKAPKGAFNILAVR
jgi:hypothetical protein